MSQLPPAAPSNPAAFQDPTVSFAGNVPQTSQGAQFLLEEQAAYAARGQAFLINGPLVQSSQAGDFWALYQYAEQFASATGWRNLPTPQVLQQMLSGGAATWDQTQIFAYMARASGVDTNAMPWALSGMTHTDWEKTVQSINSSVYELTGQESWTTLGLDPNLLQTAITQGWGASTIGDLIQKTPGLNQRYGYLRYGYNYNSFQGYKAQNQQALASRYGVGFSDEQAIANLGAPLPTFHASGSAFGQVTPYVQSKSSLPTGYAASGR